MLLYDTDKIYTLVSDLKEIKAHSFINGSNLFNFKQAVETCRIIDTFILPLYFIWELRCNRSLQDIGFEEHLEKPYQKFLMNPLTNTWELYLFISIKTPFENILGDRNLSKEIKKIFKQLLDTEKYVKEDTGHT